VNGKKAIEPKLDTASEVNSYRLSRPQIDHVKFGCSVGFRRRSSSEVRDPGARLWRAEAGVRRGEATPAQSWRFRRALGRIIAGARGPWGRTDCELSRGCHRIQYGAGWRAQSGTVEGCNSGASVAARAPSRERWRPPSTGELRLLTPPIKWRRCEFYVCSVRTVLSRERVVPWLERSESRERKGILGGMRVEFCCCMSVVSEIRVR
jgi:hypothetical protein